MKKKLTDRFLQTVAAPSAGRTAYIDTDAPGLELRVAADGQKTWSIRYRPKGDKRRRETYGAYPLISLEKARKRALAIAAAAADGRDLPGVEGRETEERQQAAARPGSLAALLTRYVEEYCKANQRRWQMTERMFQMHVPPKLGSRSLAELRRADIVELLDDLANKKGLGAQVNRVRSQIKASLNWAVEREYIDANPAAGVKKRRIESSRDRVLTDDELQAIWTAADKLSDPSRTLVKAWILSGQRRDEVRCMSWSEIDWKTKVWTVPAARNKGKRDHEIPLSPALVLLLEGLSRLGTHVFTTDGSKPYAGQKRLKQILVEKSGVDNWTFHDFRRTASTGMAALNVPQDTIDRVLNHAKKTLAGTYNRHQYLDEKRKALTTWAERVAFVVSEARDAPNVVELRPSA